MKNRELFKENLIIFILFFLMISNVYSQDQIENLDVAIDLEISATPLTEWVPRAEYNPIDNEFMVLWFATGVREQGEESMYSLHGQRVSSDGKLLGEPFSPFLSVSPRRRTLPTPVHNIFNNQYMISFIIDQELTDWDPFVTIIANDGSILTDPIAVSENPARANHPTIAFNATRGQFLVAYNDSRNGTADVFGVILNDDGSVAKEEFEICTAKGEQMNAYCCYNPIDDTYLLNWEDFRHGTDWRDPGEIYGALLDGEGNIIKDDIPMCDDYGTDDEGDQRVQNIVYNPDKNEFLASWWDSRPSLDDGGVIGRIIKADGSTPDPDFVIADAANSQSFPHLAYVEKRQMYFAVWDDMRHEDTTSETENRDVYAKWLSSSGEPVSADIPICTEERSQRYSEVIYNPVMDRCLIVWQDMVEEQAFDETDEGHISGIGGNIMGKIYGTPSFLCGQVVEEQTGAPVENARVIIIGLIIPAVETTNIGGWFNIAKTSQPQGKYFIIVYKRGYGVAIESVTYEDEPMQATIEVKKR